MTQQAAIDPTTMTPGLFRLHSILIKHIGRSRKISMLELYEEFEGVTLERHPRTHRPVENVATLSRPIRKMIDDLRDLYGVPVVGDTGAGGYYLINSRKELEDVVHQYKTRGIKSLQTAARISKNSLIDLVNQLALDLDNPDSDVRRNIKSASPQQHIGDLVLSKEAKMAVVTQHLQDMIDDPVAHAGALRELQETFGPRLLPMRVLNQLKSQSRELVKLAQQIDNNLKEV